MCICNKMLDCIVAFAPLEINDFLDQLCPYHNYNRAIFIRSMKENYRDMTKRRHLEHRLEQQQKKRALNLYNKKSVMTGKKLLIYRRLNQLKWENGNTGQYIKTLNVEGNTEFKQQQQSMTSFTHFIIAFVKTRYCCISFLI